MQSCEYKINKKIGGKNFETFCEKHKNLSTQTFSFAVDKKDLKKSCCPYFERCGNCDFLNVNYNAQLQMKNQIMQHLFPKANLKDIIGMPTPFSYRNKMQLVALSSKGETKFGFINDTTCKGVEIKNCPMQEWEVEDLLKELNAFAKHNKLKSYNFKTGNGDIRYVVARVVKNNLLLTFVVTSSKIKDYKKLHEKLQQKFDNVSIYENFNRMDNTAVFTKSFVHKLGAKTISGEMNGVKFEISPKSFLQTNTFVASQIYDKAFEFLDVQNGDRVIDCFSGIGITSLMFAKKGANVISIELEKNACLDAIRLAKANSLTSKIQVVNADCNTYIDELKILPTDKVFVDPPRCGVDQKFLKTLVQKRVSHIVYLSCNPLTLKRDCDYLTENGYQILQIQPYDMFPHTKHIETLVDLKLKENKNNFKKDFKSSNKKIKMGNIVKEKATSSSDKFGKFAPKHKTKPKSQNKYLKSNLQKNIKK